MRLADLRIGRGDAPLGGGDVGSAFEQLRRQSRGDLRQRNVAHLLRQRERRSGHADQRRNRVLQLRALHVDIAVHRARAFELGLSLRDGGGIDGSVVQLLLHDLQCSGVRGDGIVQQFLLPVERAQIEVVEREIACDGEAHRFQISLACLRIVACVDRCILHAAEQVRLPARRHADRIIGHRLARERMAEDVLRQTRARLRGAGGDRRRIACALIVDHRARCLQLRHCLGHGLIGHIDAGFETVQFVVVEERPPGAARLCIGRSRDSPAGRGRACIVIGHIDRGIRVTRQRRARSQRARNADCKVPANGCDGYVQHDDAPRLAVERSGCHDAYRFTVADGVAGIVDHAIRCFDARSDFHIGAEVAADRHRL